MPFSDIPPMPPTEKPQSIPWRFLLVAGFSIAGALVVCVLTIMAAGAGLEWLYHYFTRP